jgi:hypothetical protein
MRVGVRLSVTLGLLASAAAAACSGGYPLPPTRCDEWCDVTKGGSCDASYSPAGCVSGCEAGHITDEACAASFDAVLTCFREHPDAVTAQCSYYTNGQTLPCASEKEQLSQCVGYLYLTGSIKR